MSMNLVLSLALKFFRAHFTAYLLDLELLTASPIVIGGSLDDDDSGTTASSWVAIALQFVLLVSHVQEPYSGEHCMINNLNNRL
jgi:hypothetical protein